MTTIGSADIIRRWLAPITGHVLDVGTGDGQFLRAVLPARVEAITLVDLAPRPLPEAAARVADLAASVRMIDGNVEHVQPPVADVVLALGITDHLSNWTAIAHRLCKLARQIVIVDFPRRAWLRCRDVHTGSRADVEAAFPDGDDVEIVKTRQHWIVRATGCAG